jgi:hypothetical protein
MIRERLLVLAIAPFLVALLPALVLAQETLQRVSFHIKYIAQGVVYLDGGRAAGLKEGQKLTVERQVAPAAVGPGKPAPPPPSSVVARLKVVSVAASSAVCEVVSSSEAVQVGDLAKLTAEVVEQEKQQQRQERLTGGREYPQLITFDSGDPVVEEARAAVPRPPSPDINRMRGRIGVEYSSIFSRNNPSSTSSETGLVARVDMTRIAGTYWNFNGYWQGRFTTLSGPAAPATISDLINRTYTLNLEYDNPDSRWVAGGGRLYLPWATSLDAIDGGYFGRKVGEHGTIGVFGGSTPDPTSYDYNPDGKLGGVFLNFEGGSFDHVRYSATFGAALSAIGWHAVRQFGFTETSLSFTRKLSLYDAVEIDLPHTAVIVPSSSGTGTPSLMTTASTGGLNRSYVTLRYQPHPSLEFDLNDTYYRDFPTFDTQLIGTGLLDRYLFQGLSGGVRVNLPQKISVYTDVGKSSASSDANGSWNQMYGLTFGELWFTGLRADLRYSKFSSSFGSGDYKALSLSREFGERLSWDLDAGFQNFSSTLTQTSQTHFINTYLDWTPGRLMFFQAGYTWQRGGTMNYDQIEFIVGKRF